MKADFLSELHKLSIHLQHASGTTITSGQGGCTRWHLLATCLVLGFPQSRSSVKDLGIHSLFGGDSWTRYERGRGGDQGRKGVKDNKIDEWVGDHTGHLGPSPAADPGRRHRTCLWFAACWPGSWPKMQVSGYSLKKFCSLLPGHHQIKTPHNSFQSHNSGDMARSYIQHMKHRSPVHVTGVITHASFVLFFIWWSGEDKEREGGRDLPTPLQVALQAEAIPNRLHWVLLINGWEKRGQAWRLSLWRPNDTTIWKLPEGDKHSQSKLEVCPSGPGHCKDSSHFTEESLF